MTVTKIKLNKLDAVVVKKLKQTMQEYIQYPGNFDNEELLEIIKLQKMVVAFDQIDWVAVGQSLDGQIKKFIVALEKELT